jgi:chemotaxis protein CheZ
MDTPQTGEEDKVTEVYHRLGAITRQLHDALNELGYAEKLKGTAEELPDAQSRLQYIARLTGEAAEKVLNHVDEAKAEQDKVIAMSRQLADTIKGVPGLNAAMPELRDWAEKIQASSAKADQHLTEIMMAQDFHDLTGQVIKKVVSLAATIEDQLVKMLLATAPPEVVAVAEQAHLAPKVTPELSGPVVDAEGRTDIVTDQSQVDDLLASLGF